MSILFQNVSPVIFNQADWYIKREMIAAWQKQYSSIDLLIQGDNSHGEWQASHRERGWINRCRNGSPNVRNAMVKRKKNQKNFLYNSMYHTCSYADLSSEKHPQNHQDELSRNIQRIWILLHVSSQYHGCWWLGDIRSQGISSHGTDSVG